MIQADLLSPSSSVTFLSSMSNSTPDSSMLELPILESKKRKKDQEEQTEPKERKRKNYDIETKKRVLDDIDAGLGFKTIQAKHSKLKNK
jgi:hypothetical protein